MSAPTGTTPNEPPVGITNSYEVTVQSTDLASEITAVASSDRFPRVLATSRLVAFMEIAAARVLQPYLGEGELSVGTRVDITHLAPTSVDSQVIAQARFLERKEKMVLFEVSAKDEAGEVGRGIHERVIVETARLEGRALKRNLSVA